MKARHAKLLLVLLLAGCGGEAPASEADAGPAPAAEAPAAPPAEAPRKYPEKSGIIESKANTVGETTTLVYFDDYGAKEGTYTTTEMSGIVVRSVEISADGWHVKYDPDAREGQRWKTATAGRAAASALASIPGLSEVDPGQPGASQPTPLEPRTIAGKEAAGMEMEAMGMKVRTWTWENVALRTEVHMGGSEPMVTEVISIQFGVPVPAEKFEVPAGVEITEVKL